MNLCLLKWVYPYQYALAKGQKVTDLLREVDDIVEHRNIFFPDSIFCQSIMQKPLVLYPLMQLNFCNLTYLGRPNPSATRVRGANSAQFDTGMIKNQISYF